MRLAYWQIPLTPWQSPWMKRRRELVASEKQHRELVNSVKEGIYQSETGMEGVFTFINKADAELLGYSSRKK